MELTAGDAVAGYQIEQLVGRGSGGSVYRARTSDGLIVAVKIAPTTDPDASQRLEREAELLRRLDHRHLLRYRDLVTDDRQTVLVTDFIEGRPLAEVLAGGPLPIRRALTIARQLAAVIDHLHDEGVVHRDLSPANILIGRDDHLTLIDLGISHAPDTITLTAENALAGTPRYLAPEVIRGVAADPKADQYSVAALLHEMIAGDPWIPEAEVMATVLHHQLSTDPEPLNEIDPYVPDSVADAVLRGLSKQPDDRFASVTALVDAAGGPSTTAAPSGLTDGRIAKLAVLAAVGVFVIGVVGWQLLDNNSGAGADAATSEAPAPVPWAAGTARALDCNLLTQPDFDQGALPVDWYPTEEVSERIVDHGGVDDSAVLVIGDDGVYSQFGEPVDVLPGTAYTFTGHLGRQGDVADAKFGIAWLDANWSDTPFSEATQAVALVPSAFTMVSVTAEAPNGAVHAIPWLFKDASPGAVIADELVFAPASCELSG